MCVHTHRQTDTQIQSQLGMSMTNAITGEFFSYIHLCILKMFYHMYLLLCNEEKNVLKMTLQVTILSTLCLEKEATLLK